jgi:hypothetical protein
MSNARSTIDEAKLQSGARKYSRIVDEAKMEDKFTANQLMPP